MKTIFSWRMIPAGVCLFANLLIVACNSGQADPRAGAPPKAAVEPDLDANNFKVDHPERFPLAIAAEHKALSALNVTGVVQPDIVRAVPVVSLASGRVVEIRARLGDAVKKGQLLLRVQSNDVSGAYQTYLKAENDERLARTQLERAQILYEKGADCQKCSRASRSGGGRMPKPISTPQSNNCAFWESTSNILPAMVDIVAPICRIITDQQVTNSSGVQGLSGPNPFTIADLSYVWIVCDVYENDLDAIRVGEYADIHLNAYPNRPLKGRIDNILPDARPQYPHSQGALEVKNLGGPPYRHVCQRYFLWQETRDVLRCSCRRNSSLARS